jgi:hypothetical protein
MSGKPGRPARPVIDRIASHVALAETGCLIWTAALGRDGYARVRVIASTRVYKNVPVHRVVYEYVVGPIPEGMQIDHLCRNRACCRPEHLEPVTIRENLLRGETHAAANAAKTHCANGHPFSGENLSIQVGRYQRVCKACKRAEARRRYWAKQVAAA